MRFVAGLLVFALAVSVGANPTDMTKPIAAPQPMTRQPGDGSHIHELPQADAPAEAPSPKSEDAHGMEEHNDTTKTHEMMKDDHNETAKDSEHEPEPSAEPEPHAEESEPHAEESGSNAEKPGSNTESEGEPKAEPEPEPAVEEEIEVKSKGEVESKPEMEGSHQSEDKGKEGESQDPATTQNDISSESSPQTSEQKDQDSGSSTFSASAILVSLCLSLRAISI